ncbi:MAG: HAMP domain-containing histidine kinase, partial [Clostridia bacterium]|nr:HAMP domain-containing histidine kinase [Deltaproteobacteria bacterium]
MGKLDALQLAGQRSSVLTRYMLPVLLTACSILMRFALRSMLGDHAPYITFYGGVALATWFGGAGPGAVAALGGLIFAILFRPTADPAVGTREIVAHVAYCISSGIIIGFGANARATKLRLAASALELQDLNRKKDGFLAMLAHELRNPLAPIISATELLARLPPGDPRAIQQRRMVARQVHHLKRMIDDLLDASRLLHSRMTLECEAVDFREAVHEGATIVRDKIKDKTQTLRVEVPEVPVVVFADRVRLTQIVANLLDNACKYTQDRGTIRASVQRVDGHAQFTVRDNGLGMSDDTLASIFAPFVQAPRTLDRGQGGL